MVERRHTGPGHILVGTWFQVSRRYRSIACLPKGKSGVEALAEASGDPEWAEGLREMKAGDQYLRVYAGNEGNCMDLTRFQFRQFRDAGGATYGMHKLHDLELLARQAPDWPRVL